MLSGRETSNPGWERSPHTGSRAQKARTRALNPAGSLRTWLRVRSGRSPDNHYPIGDRKYLIKPYSNLNDAEAPVSEQVG